MTLDLVGETVDDPYAFVPDSSSTDATMLRLSSLSYTIKEDLELRWLV